MSQWLMFQASGQGVYFGQGESLSLGEMMLMGMGMG